MAIRSVFAVEFRVGSWKPSPPASKRRPHSYRQDGRAIPELLWWRVQPSVDRTGAVLDTGAIDHDAHSGLVADEIDHKSGDLAGGRALAATGGQTVRLRRPELAVGGLVEPGGEGKVVGEAPVCAQVAVGRGRHRGGEKVIALWC